MTLLGLVLSALGLLIWLVLVFGRGGFWRAREHDQDTAFADPAAWPDVVAVIPARDEADVIGQAIGSLLRQDYPGRFAVMLVDDGSRDGTAEVARRTAEALRAGDRLTIVAGEPLPPGWTGKLWAMKQGVLAAERRADAPKYLLLTDADIAYEPEALRRLAARAEAQGTVLTSVMVKLRCDSFAERWFIPAFVFFFQMLYPFGWVNDPRSRTAAAAGGCMLVRREALHAAGGIESIRGALIDDCALGARMKAVGPTWLGLTRSIHSLRPYDNFEDVRRMVARSAYAQLHYSKLMLAGTVLGMVITYLAPPLFALFGSGWTRIFGATTWLLMALSFQPILRLYGRSPLWGLALPLIAAVYTGFTLDSAYQYMRGRGGMWKGRAQANVVGTR